ncbi:hypothetical protein ASE00_03260 [Sphingomonas sp. Root710]|uniref:M20/M25/M40 family metallo-hydrolase n=1 Tax=Sphingomonas sp. Root710 TaxID=1736594 RepID=UPI0006F7C868|nr:M20/M25/M40 family metallo-hydrolase [Sphingomonas sp. Root710]KRB85800.1 hypothetical protein ASE00_03260 [Sphingomonas sp. Root710]
MRRAIRPFLAALACAIALPAPAATISRDQHDETLAIWKKMVSIPTVQGRGQMPVMANYVAELLRKGGFAAADVIIEGDGDATSLVARYRGTGKGKPILLSGHMDVVEARAADWTRDPFVPVEENGYLYGRGSLDMKFGDAVLVSTLLKLKAEGFRPGRDIILLLSGDEETEMATTRRLAQQYGVAELLLNADGGGGLLDAQGKPVAFYVQGAEKTYADFEISITNPGGHSSRPGATNAIYDLAKAIDRIAAYQFPAQVSELTRAYWQATGKLVGGQLGAAMHAFAENPKNEAALATLRADPEYIGITGTTCVATMLSGGHALNALPQKASVSVNCRIFPGTTIESVKAKLADVIANPQATITTLGGPVASDASPLRPDLMKALRKGVDLSYPGLPIIPQMSAGATDSLYFRAVGIPSYGVIGMFIKPEDDYSHGLNERAPVASLDPALLMMRTLLVDLAK